jgi:hypothetical protein
VLNYINGTKKLRWFDEKEKAMARRTDKENYNDKNKLHLFNHRLMDLMDNSEYNSANKLAVALLDQKLVGVKHRDETKPIDKNAAAVKSVEKKILRHLDSEEAKRVQGEFISAYSRLFNVSTEYILCLTNIKSRDMDVRAICEATGLSEELVARLIKNSPMYPYSKWFNKMFEMKNAFNGFIRSLEDFDLSGFDKTIPNPFNAELHDKFDEETINKAYDLVLGSTVYEDGSLDLSEKEIEAIKLVENALGFDYEQQQDNDLMWKVLRYELAVSSEELIDALLSCQDKDSNVFCGYKSPR